MTTKTATLRDNSRANNAITKLSDDQEIRFEQFALQTLSEVAANSKSDAVRLSAARGLLEWRFSKNRRDGVNKVQTQEEKIKEYQETKAKALGPLIAAL